MSASLFRYVRQRTGGPASARELIAVLALSSIVFVGVEIEKLIKRSQKTA